MESIFKLDLRSEKNSVPACGFISKLNQFQLESVWLSSSLSSTLFFLFFLLLLILCTDLSATLSTEDTRLLFVVHNSHTYPIALAQTLTAPWREGGGSGVFPQKLPPTPQNALGKHKRQRKRSQQEAKLPCAVGGSLSGAAPFLHHAPAPPPSTRKCFSFKQYGAIQEPTSKEQTLIVSVGDLQKGRLIFHSPQLFPLLLIPFSALIKLMDI